MPSKLDFDPYNSGTNSGGLDFDPYVETTQAAPAAPAIARPDRSWVQAATDTYKGVATGVGNVISGAGTLYGLATGDMDNAATRFGGSVRDYWQERQSDALKADKAARSAAIDQADGILGKAGTAIKETIKNPSLLADTVAENIATFIPAAGAARVGSIASKAAGATAATAARVGTGAGIGVGAVQQGADVAQGAYDAAIAKPDAVWNTNAEYAKRVAAGESPDAVKHSMALESARIAMPAAAAVSVATQFLPGASMAERFAAGATAKAAKVGGKEVGGLAGRAVNAAKGVAGEGAQEALEEGGGQFAANLTNRNIDQNQSLSEGVGEAAGMGFVGGAGLGGIAGAAQRPRVIDEVLRQEGVQNPVQPPFRNAGTSNQPTDTSEPPAAPPAAPTFDHDAIARGLDKQADNARTTALFEGRDQPAPPTLLDGSPLPDPNAGPLSRSVNVGVESGAVPVADPFDMTDFGATTSTELPPDGFERLGMVAQGLGLDPDAIVAAARADMGDDTTLDTLDDRILATYAQSLGAANGPAQEVAGPVLEQPGLAAVQGAGDAAALPSAGQDQAGVGAVEAAGQPAEATGREVARADDAGGAPQEAVGGLENVSDIPFEQIGDIGPGGDLTRPMVSEQDWSELKSAGFVQVGQAEDGSRYEYVPASALWDERERRSLSKRAASKAKGVSEDEVRQARERRAAFYDRVADDAEAAGDAERAAEIRAKAAGIRNAQATPSSTRESPLPREREADAPVGAWVAGPDVPGVSPADTARQIIDMPLDQIDATEFTADGKIIPDKRADAAKYAEAMRNGDTFPNARGSELPNGKIKLQDGHRRLAAAMENGQATLRVAVNPMPQESPQSATAEGGVQETIDTDPVLASNKERATRAATMQEAEFVAAEVSQAKERLAKATADAATAQAARVTFDAELAQHVAATKRYRLKDGGLRKSTPQPLVDAEAKLRERSVFLRRSEEMAAQDRAEASKITEASARAMYGRLRERLQPASPNAQSGQDSAQSGQAAPELVAVKDRYGDTEAREQAAEPNLDALRAEVKAAQEAWDANGESPMTPTWEAERKAKADAEQKQRETTAKAARTRAEKKASKPKSQMTSKEIKAAEAAKAAATHADPGEAPEVVTPAVIAEAAKTADHAPTVSMAEARKVLLAKLDAAIKAAPEGGVLDDPPTIKKMRNGRKTWDVDIGRKVDGLSVPEMTIVENHNGTQYTIGRINTDKTLATEHSLLAARLTAARLQQGAAFGGKGKSGGWAFNAVAPADTITLDVPGDGTFKVRNTKERLTAFRAQVDKWFKLPKHESPKPESLTVSQAARDKIMAEAETVDDAPAPVATPGPLVTKPTPNSEEAPKAEAPATPSAARETQPTNEAASNKGAEAAPAKIDDFGERLEGARKFLPPGLKEEVSDDEIVAMPLSKIWPADAYLEVEDPMTAAMAFAARDEIPAKPRKPQLVKKWAEKVKMFRALMQQFTGESMPRMIELAEKQGSASLVSEFFPRVQLLAQLPRETWKRVEKVGQYPTARRMKTDAELKADGITQETRQDSSRYTDYYRTVNGAREKINIFDYGDYLFVARPFSSVTIDGKTHHFEVPALGPDEVQKVLELLGKEAPKKGGLTSKDFEVRTNTKTKITFINRKGDAAYRPLKQFTGDDAVKQAMAFRKDHVADLEVAWEQVKARDNVGKGDTRRDDNNERVGENRRNGKDVTPAMFEAAFGFRGVQFGNWVAQGKGQRDRQGLINEAYDALLDLADILGIPSKAISLEGSLGLAFGARGHGKHSAHFEPDNLVINLTKTRGAGTLAHEWFHALDNYFAAKRGRVPFNGDNKTFRENNYITYKPEPMLRSKRGFGVMTRAEVERRKKAHPTSSAYDLANWEPSPNHREGVRPVVEASWASLVSALNDSPMAARAASIDGVKVRGGAIQTDGYWSRIIERGARSFENYVITKMAQRGWSNDFLANIRSWEQWQATGKNAERYPYLRPDEEGPIVEAFDNLFATIESRETDTGVALESVEELTDADLTPAERAAFERQAIDRKGLREKLSREQGEADADANGLRAAVQKVLGASGNKVIFLRDVNGLPSDVRGPQERAAAQRGASMRTAGIFHPASGTVYLFTDVVKNPQMAAFTASHEIAGHLGLRALLGNKLNSALDRAVTNKTVRAVAESMTRQRNLRPDQRHLAIEEALADLAAAQRTGNYDRIKEKHGVEVPTTMRSGLRATIARFIEAVRNLFRTKDARFSDAQVYSLLENAWKAAQNVETQAADSDAVRLSQRSNDNANTASGIPAGLPVDRTAASDRLQQSIRAFVRGAGEPAIIRAVQPDSLPDTLRRAFAAIERVGGARVVVVRHVNADASGFRFNGVTLRQGVLYVSDDSNRPAVTVAAHEFTHQLTNDHPELYARLENEIRRQGRIPEYAQSLIANGEVRERAARIAPEELTADAVGDALSDPTFLRSLAARNRSLFQELADAFMAFFDSLTGNVRNLSSNKYLTDVKAFRDLLADVLEQVAATPQSALESVTDETRAAYEARIDALFAGDKAALKGARILDRSDVLGMMGLGEGPMNIAEGKVIEGRYNHRMTAEHWKKVPEWLENPALVFQSEQGDGSRLVFIAPETVGGEIVRMIVQPNAKQGMDVHLLVNAYDAPGGNPMMRWAQEGLLRYVDTKKSPALAARSGRRLPGLADKPRGSDAKVLSQADLFKYRQAKAQEPLRDTGTPEALESVESGSLEGMDRAAAVAEAKRLGLPATGKTDAIANLVRIANTPPAEWSRADFDAILPHLSVHQDARGDGGGNVEAIMRDGLNKGMVDSAAPLEPGAKGWSWAKGYAGNDVYVFISGGLKYRAKGDPRLAPGNKPLFHAKPAKGGSLFDAITANTFNESAYRPAVVSWAKSKFGDRVAPNGKPAWQNFTEWFADSAVVNEKGEPAVSYHGTDAEFDTFRPSETGVFGPGIYFSNQDEGSAELYGDETIPAYLRIENPWRIDADVESPAAYREDFDHPSIDAVLELPRGRQMFDRIKRMDSEHFDAELQESLIALGYDGVIATYPDGSQEIVAFKPEQVKSSIHNSGNFSPEQGSILESVEDLTESLGNAMNNVRGVKLPAGYLLADLLNRSQSGALHWWHKSVGTMYNLAQRSPLFKQVFDRVQDMVADVSHYANSAMDLAPDILPKFDSMRDALKKKPMSAADAKKVSAALFDGTLKWARDANGDIIPSGGIDKAGVVWTDEELASRFGMDERQRDLYRQTRRAIDKSLDDTATTQMLRFMGEDGLRIREEVLASGSARQAYNIIQRHVADMLAGKFDLKADGRESSLEEAVKRAKEVADQVGKLKDRGYAPLSRFGRFTVYKDGENPIFLMFETQREANRAARKLSKQYGSAVRQGTMSQEQFKLFKGMTPETLELFGEMLGLDATGNEQDDLIFQTFIKAAKSNRSALKRLIHREGVAGYSEDVPRVLASFLYSNARLAATNLHAANIQEAIQAIPKEEGDLKDAAIRLNEYIVNPDDAGAFLQSFNFAQFLGGSIASAMVNMTQPLTMSFPWLSQYGGAWKAARALAEASKLAVKNGTTGNHLLDDALKRADADGHTQPQEVHQLQAYADGRGVLRAGDGTKAGDAAAKAYNAKARIMLAWGLPFSLAEQFNRRTTFIAAWNTAVEQGMADPYGFAVQAVQATQGIYNKANKPQWSRNAIGGMAFTFKQYSINYVEMLHRMWVHGGKEGKQGVLLAVAVMFLLAGAGGLPGADDLDDLLDGLMQRLGYNFSSKQAREEFFANLIGEQGAKFMEHGLSSTPGMPIDVSGRLGMGNLLPSTGLLVRKEDHGRDIAEIAGPTGDIIKRTVESLGMLAEGKVGASILNIAPRAVSNAWKGVEMASTGEYRDTKGRKVIDTTPGEAAAKLIGFQPATAAKVQQASGKAYDLLGNYRVVAADIADRWAKGIHDGDADAVAEAQQDLAEWNAKNPDMPIRISRGSLQRRVFDLRLDRRQRLAKTTPKAVRSQVEAMLDDTSTRRMRRLAERTQEDGED